MISSPGDDDVIVLIDGEGVVLFVEVEDLHQVSVATNAVSGAANCKTQSFNGLLGSCVDFGGLEKFDFHDWFGFDIYIVNQLEVVVHSWLQTVIIRTRCTCQFEC